jgi:hypothetical protein
MYINYLIWWVTLLDIVFTCKQLVLTVKGGVWHVNCGCWQEKKQWYLKSKLLWFDKLCWDLTTTMMRSTSMHYVSHGTIVTGTLLWLTTNSLTLPSIVFLRRPSPREPMMMDEVFVLIAWSRITSPGEPTNVWTLPDTCNVEICTVFNYMSLGDIKTF